MKRTFVLLAALGLFAAAHAQQQTVLQFNSTPVLDVQRLAPQLVAFAGGDVNFANLVNGLALGVPVTLTTTAAPGLTEVSTFTPSGTMSATQIAQVLETARQQLIARGIATPSAQQLATTLVGGTFTTALGNTTVAGLVPTSSAVSTTTTPGATTPAGMSPAAALQAARNPAAGATSAPRTNTSDSPFPRGISDTPPLPTAPAAPTTVVAPPAAINPTPAAAPTTRAPLGAR